MIPPEIQKNILAKQVKTMITEVSERVGDENPYLDMNIDDLDLAALGQLKRSLHEVLYVPPPRSR